MFEVKREAFREGSTLRDTEQAALDIRRDLLIKFSQVFSKVIKLVNMTERNVDGSLSNKHFTSRYLSLSVAINSLVDRQLANIPDGGRANFAVNRRKAQEF
mgnify:CR=1 FL=1